MKKPALVVRLSSKGQVVVPAELRRRLALKTGEVLQVRPGKGREVVFTPLEDIPPDADDMLARIRSAAARSGRDLVEELHERRRRERELEEARSGRRRS